MFEKIEKTLMPLNVMKQVLKAIRDQKLNPGDRLPPERELAVNFDVSRPILREGIGALSFLGILEKKWGSGYVVSKDPTRSIISNSFKYIVISKEKEIRDVFEARKAIECELICLAATRRQPEHLQMLEQSIEELKAEPKTSPKRVQTDYEFHRTIGEASDSRILQSLQLALREKIIDTLQIGAFYPDAADAIEKAHSAMFTAIKNSYVNKARELMADHLELSLHRHMERLKTLETLPD
jgi:GntR family transcriptional repressor for pyruvate dehydrogenase complex